MQTQEKELQRQGRGQVFCCGFRVLLISFDTVLWKGTPSSFLRGGVSESPAVDGDGNVRFQYPKDVLVRVTVAMMKDHDQKQLEEEGNGLFGFHCQTLII